MSLLFTLCVDSLTKTVRRQCIVFVHSFLKNEFKPFHVFSYVCVWSTHSNGAIVQNNAFTYSENNGLKLNKLFSVGSYNKTYAHSFNSALKKTNSILNMCTAWSNTSYVYGLTLTMFSAWSKHKNMLINFCQDWKTYVWEHMFAAWSKTHICA